MILFLPMIEMLPLMLNVVQSTLDLDDEQAVKGFWAFHIGW